METSITLGSDPELFLCDESGALIPAGCLLPDGKQFEPNHGPSLVRDGMMLEMRPVPGCTVDEAVRNTRQVLMEAHELARANGLELNPVACMPVTENTMNNCTPDALIFGCDPDWSAYTGRKQVIQVDAAKHPWRYAGGHIHIGTGKLRNPRDIIALCKVFDLFVGLSTVLMDRSRKSSARRRLYGRAGSFRPQPHGFEWRVPSNFWLRSPVLTRAIFELSVLAYNIWESEEGEKILGVLDTAGKLTTGDDFSTIIRQTIDGSDAMTAKKILADACGMLKEHIFPSLWWDIAMHLMRCRELPFAPLHEEWGFGLSESEFNSGNTRLRFWTESLTSPVIV